MLWRMIEFELKKEEYYLLSSLNFIPSAMWMIILITKWMLLHKNYPHRFHQNDDPNNVKNLWESNCTITVGLQNQLSLAYIHKKQSPKLTPTVSHWPGTSLRKSQSSPWVAGVHFGACRFSIFGATGEARTAVIRWKGLWEKGFSFWNVNIVNW